MDSSSWRIQIFQMSSLASQQSMIDLLAKTPLVVDGQSCDQGIFLIVESRGESEARLVSELVVMTDTAARLLHETPKAQESVEAAG